jgi:hypothetical protein
VIQSDVFVAAPCIDCDVRGYLVLRALVPYEHLFSAPLEFQTQLGIILAKLEAAILSVIRAEHVYIVRFSEALPSVHFHLFPRTDELAGAFLQENLDVKTVNGPLLFDWARRKYHVDTPEALSASTISAAERIRAAL